jgi:hypothetical protein
MQRQNSIVATYLFAWNPKLWNWPELNRDRARLARQGFIDIRWASGRVRQIEPGSRAFLVRLGVPPKGLFGDGYTLSAPQLGPHWRPDKRALGIPALYLRIRLNSLFDHPVVTFDELAEPPFARYRWGVRQSGAYVPSTLADPLEALWEKNVAALGKIGVQIPSRSPSVPRVKQNQANVAAKHKPAPAAKKGAATTQRAAAAVKRGRAGSE